MHYLIDLALLREKELRRIPPAAVIEMPERVYSFPLTCRQLVGLAAAAVVSAAAVLSAAGPAAAATTGHRSAYPWISAELAASQPAPDKYDPYHIDLMEGGWADPFIPAAGTASVSVGTGPHPSGGHVPLDGWERHHRFGPLPNLYGD